PRARVTLQASRRPTPPAPSPQFTRGRMRARLRGKEVVRTFRTAPTGSPASCKEPAMMRPWHARLHSRFFPGRQARRAAPAIRPSRPWLEPLEGRVVPTVHTYTVTTTANSGTSPLSLRQAIADVNSDNSTGTGTDIDTIQFGISTNDANYNFGTGAWTITLTSGLPAITKSVKITGPGADALTVSGNNVS